MDDFTRKILNLRPPKEDIQKLIEETLLEYFKEYPEYADGMCFIHTTNIKEHLKTKSIKTYQINSLDLGSSFEHYFLLIDNVIDLYLVDPTYSQFDSANKTKINNKLKAFPANTLNITPKGKELYQRLITDLYSKVDIEDIMLYLDSLETKNIKDINEFIIKASK